MFGNSFPKLLEELHGGVLGIVPVLEVFQTYSINHRSVPAEQDSHQFQVTGFPVGFDEFLVCL
jgi:hypothetical protein